MALKIRLRQQGSANRQVYRLVVTDSRNPRDGKYIEMVGWYHPQENEPEKNFSLKGDRIQHWLNLGAQLTEKAQTLVKNGVPHVIAAEKQKEAGRQDKARLKRKKRKTNRNKASTAV